MVRWKIALLTVVLFAAIIGGCGFGSYWQEVHFQPQLKEGWKRVPRPVWGKDYAHPCNQGWVLIDAITVEAEKVAQGVLFIPIPSKNVTMPSSMNGAIPFTVIFLSTGAVSCHNLISVKGGELPHRMDPALIGEGDRFPPARYCTYSLPVGNVGDKFSVEFNSKAINCIVGPLEFRLVESRNYRPLIGQ